MSAAAAVAAPEKARAAIAAARQILGGEIDAFGQAWDKLTEDQRRFWLHYSRLRLGYAGYRYMAIPKADRDILKNNLYRGAVEMQKLLGAMQ